MTKLYRLAVLALLTYCVSTMAEIDKRQRVLLALAQHPPREPFLSPADPGLRTLRRAAFDKGLVSSTGEYLGPPPWLVSASPAATPEPSATPASTEESGRWTPTSGAPTEDGRSLGDPSWLQNESRTSSPTAGSKTAAGSPGSAPAPSASIPRHNHDSRLVCQLSCPAYFAVQKDKIEASGFHAICVPSLTHPMADCNEHPHVPGERR